MVAILKESGREVTLAGENARSSEGCILPSSRKGSVASLVRSRRRYAELMPGDLWDSDLVANLIAEQSSETKRPAQLFLGVREAGLLKDHLNQVFGYGAAASLKGCYYQGLEVVELQISSYLRVAGEKKMSRLQTQLLRRAERVGSDFDQSASYWSFSIED